MPVSSTFNGPRRGRPSQPQRVEIYAGGTLIGFFNNTLNDLRLTGNNGLRITGGGIQVNAGGLTIDSGNLDLNSSGTLINVGVAGNDWTATALAVSGTNSGAVSTITVLNSSNDTSAGARVKVTAGGSTASGDAAIEFTETSGHIMTIGIDISGSLGVIAMDTALGSSDGDAIRITDATPPVATYNATHPTGTFDYVCGECGKHAGEVFSCCGLVEWHDDVAALVPLLASATGVRLTGDEPAVQHLAKIGVMEVTPSDFPGEEGRNWVGIRLDKAQWFTWSAMKQMYDRINEQEERLVSAGL